MKTSVNWWLLIGIAAGGLYYLKNKADGIVSPNDWESMPGDKLEYRIEYYAEKYQLDKDLVKAVIFAESSFNPNAVNRNEKGGTSSWGLMQIWYPGTANLLGYTGPPEGLLDVDLNLDMGCYLLRDITSRYTNLKDIIASYNSGHPKFRADGSYINQTYVDRVLERLDYYKAGGA